LQNGKTVDDIKALFAQKYNSAIVKYDATFDDSGFISAAKLKDSDAMTVTVAGNDDRILLIAVYNNLGKGASGAAIECMNVVLEQDKSLALDI
jgi:N-acetyl-gamma-glutamyl-phosphate reductase